MKRFGLKAIAASLALLMTASLSAPAAAEAADKLLVTSAGGNVLVITQDMVDSEGEFVLSGEDFDKVVLPADVEIKNLYVDGCEIGEFTVEGGNNPKVQLWDAQIKNVTVSAPSLVDENKAIAEYLDLYKGKESAEDFDVDGFFKNVRETNERLNSLVPEIRLMGADMESSEQAIGAVTLAGNAKVNFTKGKTPDAVNVAFNSAQAKMDVTIEGYKGDINVDQTTGKENAFGILNIKTKKSEIGNVNVKAQGNANIALRSSDSKAATVNFDSKGDASAVLTVAAPTDNLKVAGSASNATVKVLTSLISADIQGKSITMDLGPAASVETATIAGSGNVVSGSGDLVDCTIAEGSSAAVQIPGAAVAGDNSYQPIISAPSVSGGSSSGGSTGGNTGNTDGNGGKEEETVTLPTLPEGSLVVFGSTLTGGYGYNKTIDSKAKTITLEYTQQYGEVQPQFADIPLTDYKEVRVAVSSSVEGSSNLTVKVVDKDAEKNEYEQLTEFTKSTGNPLSSTVSEIVVDLTDYSDKFVKQIGIMNEAKGCTATIYRIAFIPREGANIENTQNPNANLPANSYTFNDLVPTEKWLDNADCYSVDANGVATITSETNYRSVFFKIPDTIDTSRLESITFNGLTCTKQDMGAYFAVKVHTEEQYSTEGKPAAKTEYGATITIPEGVEAKYFSIMSSAGDGQNGNPLFEDYPFEITCNSVTFKLKEKIVEPEVIDTFDFISLIPTAKWLEETTETGSYYNVDANGVATITCVGNYKSVFFEIPDTIDTTRLKSVTFNGLTCTKQDLGAYFAVKVHTAEQYAAEGKPGTTAYNTSVTVPEGSEVAYISIMSSAGDGNNGTKLFEDFPFEITCNSVTFNLE